MRDICEQNNVCDNDQKSFKAYTSRWLSITTQLAPYTYDTIYPYLVSSAIAAAQQCSGGSDGTTCGLKWYENGTWDGTDGPGQQMGAMEIFLATLAKEQPALLTNKTGGTSISQPNAGFNETDTSGFAFSTSTKAGKVGAWIVTAFMLVASIFAIWFMNTELLESGGAGPEARDRKRQKRLSKLRRSGAPAESQTLRLSRGSVGVLPTVNEMQEKPAPIYLGGTEKT